MSGDQKLIDLAKRIESLSNADQLRLAAQMLDAGLRDMAQGIAATVARNLEAGK